MILHIDMDAFFASIEQRENKELQGKPIIVSGNSKRSVVSAASYEARKFGIYSAMPVFMAKQKCPDLIIVRGSMRKYANYSDRIMEILHKFSPLAEKISIDEAFLDIKGSTRLFGTPEKIGYKIKKRIKNEIDLSCSIGIAPLKFLAKIASDIDKPNGLTIIKENQVMQFISKLPIQKVPGVGKTTMKNMEILQIKTLGDINKYNIKILNKKFGKMGYRLLELANGIDKSIVKTDNMRKSISNEKTLLKDTFDFQIIKQILLGSAQSVGRTLRKKNLVCQNVFIKLKFSDFSQITRNKKLNSPICSSTDIFDKALDIYKKIKLKKKIRLAGVGVMDLKNKNNHGQLELFCDKNKKKENWEYVDKAVDIISEKFGNDIVKKASLK